MLYDVLKKNENGEIGDTFDSKALKAQLKKVEKNSEEYKLLKKVDNLLSKKSSLNKSIKNEEKELKDANGKIEDAITETFDDSMEIAKRGLEKVTNEKIMAIDEYSNTVLESMNKTHNEVLFLYSMLNDKHTELTKLASHLQHFSDEVKNTETEALENLSAVASELEQKATVIPKTEENITEQAVVEQTVPEQELHEEEETDDANHNEKILMLCRQGMSDVEIARTLGLGLGEVRLVIGLYKGEQTSEV